MMEKQHIKIIIKWFECNDSIVSEINLNEQILEKLGPQVVMLIYHKVNPQEDNNINNQKTSNPLNLNINGNNIEVNLNHSSPQNSNLNNSSNTSNYEPNFVNSNSYEKKMLNQTPQSIIQ